MTSGGAPSAPGDPEGHEEVTDLVADLFRRSFARIVSSHTRALGAEHLHLVEESVQDALVRALQRWPFHGVPQDPEAWLFTVARNRALDRLRRAGRLEAAAELPLVAASARDGDPGDGELLDDELALVVLCCHPRLSPDARVALTLRLAGGLSVKEIADAFLVPPATVAQRIVRAKRTLREEGADFGVPSADRLDERLDSVLRVVYLLFNEGYASREGDAPVRPELCGEAVRLGRLLADHPRTSRPEVEALLALMLFQASRLRARTDAAGGIVTLEEQDRTLWDRHLVQEGMVHLARAGRGRSVTPYHLEAGIAAIHAVAPSFEETDWPRILSYYDVLLDVAPSPVVEANRAVAVSMVEGPDAGLAALDRAAGDDALERYRLLPAIRGMLLERAGRREEAAAQLRRALMAAESPPRRRFLEKRLARIDRRPGGADR